MAEARVTNPLVEQFRKGGVPRELRVMAAQGALPLRPEDLLELLTDLVGDSDPAVQQAAAKSLRGFPENELLPVLKSRDTPSAVLAWAVAHRTERDLREAALQNTSLPDETIEALAASLPPELAELVVINQVRLLRRTSLLVTVESNPNLNNDQRRRLRELRETFKIGEQPAEAAPPPSPPPEPEAPPPPVEEVPLFEAISEEEAKRRFLSEEELQQTEKVSVVQKLYRLTTKEKLDTAMKGTREERAILIRDTNRLVSAAVISSQKTTEAEAEVFAAMKNISEDILRYIGKNREWTKRYPLVKNLVCNPRTPLDTSLHLVSRLNPRDIKSVAVDKNVPEAIRKQAQKFIKGEDKRPGGGKH